MRKVLLVKKVEHEKSKTRKRATHRKSATRKEYNSKKKQHEATRKKIITIK